MKNKKVRMVVLAVVALAVGLVIAQVIQGAEPKSKSFSHGKNLTCWSTIENVEFAVTT